MNNMHSINKNNDLKNWKAPIVCFFVFFFVILILFIQFCYLSLSEEVYGINMQEFASNRNTVTSILNAERGTIYDIEGNVLAQNITSYTLIAYLDPKRTTDPLKPAHVVDKDYTATKLAKIFGEDRYEYIYKRLNSSSKQVEFGNMGKNLTELTKISIEELDLPGISFTETVKRYYPNGNFASYVIGYAKQYTKINIKVNESYDLYNYYKNFFNNYENVTIKMSKDDVISLNNTTITGLKEGNLLLSIKSNNDLLETIYVNVTNYENYETLGSTIIGELGIESNFEDELQGTDGYIIYQQDKYGYQIPDTNEETIKQIDGKNIYLTLNSNIQRFAESAIDSIEKYNPEWAFVTVMDAKNGAILASATSPSYNPNSLSSDMSYQNPLVSYTYEPGSVMKIYTYMCAIETGMYDGDKEYLSGSYVFKDGTKMHDWDKRGWGTLTYDVGFSYSSNTAIINIINDYLSRKKLNECLDKYGFGKKTGIELSGEAKGSIDFKYETEVMAAGFGQGISITPIQQLQALSIVANDGVMVTPHIIDKIVDVNTKEEVVTKIKKSNQLVSSKTISKVKDLMESVILPESLTGGKYYLEGYDIIGKTGTAQIYENGKYLTGENDYIISVALMYPKDDPEVIIYTAVKKPESTTLLYKPMKELIKNISKYKSMFSESETNKENKIHIIDSYINKDLTDTKNKLEKNNIKVITIGDGNKIINQYPSKNTKLIYNDKIFLMTNSNNILLEDVIGWSKNDTLMYCNLLNIKCTFKGNGYVISQSLSKGTKIDKNTNLEIELDNINNKKEELEDEDSSDNG